MKRLAIIGAGEFGKQVAEIAVIEGKVTPIAYYDDFASDKEFNQLPIVGKIDQLTVDFEAGKFDCLFVAVGYNHLRFKQKIMREYSHIPFATIIHPSSVIEEAATIGAGVFIYAMVYIGAGVVLSDGVVVNVKTLIPHDNHIGECTCFSGGVNMGGKTDVGSCSFIGLGVTVSDCLSVCDDVFVGAGALVIRSIEEPGIYIGSPARILKKTND